MTELPGSRPLSRQELPFVSAKNKQACVFYVLFIEGIDLGTQQSSCKYPEPIHRSRHEVHQKAHVVQLPVIISYGSFRRCH